MATESGDTVPKKRKSRQKSQAPEATAPAKQKKPRKTPRARGEDEPTAMEENPGLLLGDFVDSIQLPAKTRRRTAAPAASKRRPRAARHEEAADELAGLGFDAEEGAADLEAEDAEASSRLLGALGKLAAAEADASARPASRQWQAQPESEFHAGAIDEEVTVEDLLQPLQEGPAFGDVRRQLQGLAKRDSLPEPVSEVKKTTEERRVQYEASSKDIGKWQAQVQRMRKAEQVSIDTEPVLTKTTKELVGNFSPMDDFERELEEVTKAAGATEEDVRGAKVLPMNPRLREEHQTREVARLKALMMRQQQTHKRLNKIKSKTYRRIHRKSETKDREVMLQRLELENPELAKQLKQDYERKHAEKRMLRQRNARRKWTQTMQRFAKGDQRAAQEISKQAQKAHDEEQALRRAIQGKDPDQSEDSEAVDLSGSEGEEVTGKKAETKRTLAKAQRLTVDEIKSLEAEGELPTKGFLGMKFMREAIKQKREGARQDAVAVLKELEGMEDKLADSDDEDEEGKKAGSSAAETPQAKTLPKFSEEELAAARAEVDSMLDQEDNVTGCTVSGPLTIHGVKAAEVSKPRSRSKGQTTAPETCSTAATPASSSSRPPQPASDDVQQEDNPWLSENPWTQSSTGDGDLEELSGQPADAGSATSKRKKRKAAKPDKATPPAAEAQQPEEELAAEASDDVLAALSLDSAEAQAQRDLVRTAFIEGTQEDDFEAELEDEAQQKEEKEKAKNGELAGWGSWTGEGAPKPRIPKGKGKGKQKPAASAERPRQNSAVFYEGKAEHGKYFVEKIPYGYQTPEQFDQEMRMPTGPEWNALPAHLKRIQPKFFSKVGAIVPPLQLVRHLPKEQRAGVIDKWAASKQPKRLKAKI